MYLPKAFRVDDHETVLALLRTAGFGHLVVASDGDGPASSPVPFVVDDALGSVRAHVARGNPIWKAAPCPALLIVPVSDTYISPGWYPSKAEHGKVVPTWNYEVVHVHGALVAHDDGAWVATQIRDLTDQNEATLPSPWAVDDAPADYIEQLQRRIVGLELTVQRVVAKRKLSQNRDDGDLAAVIAGLIDTDRRGATAIVDAMMQVDEER